MRHRQRVPAPGVKSEVAVLNKQNGVVAYRFHARDLNVVMGQPAPGASVKFRITIGAAIEQCLGERARLPN